MWVLLGTATAGLVAFVVGVVVRRRRTNSTSSPSTGAGSAGAAGAASAEMQWWTITVDGQALEVMGPFRNADNVVYALKPSEQIQWADENSARLPTQAEFDQIWAQADVKVDPVPRDVETAPLDALNADVQKALDAFGVPTLRVSAGKTWLSMDDNYGWLMDVEDTTVDAGVRFYEGIKVYATTIAGAFAIQPVSDFHAGTDHVDYSQLGYIVREPAIA